MADAKFGSGSGCSGVGASTTGSLKLVSGADKLLSEGFVTVQVLFFLGFLFL